MLTEQPTTPANPHRQHKLHNVFGSRAIGGNTFEQWQYEVTASGRIWYCPDPDKRIVWITKAGCGHPKQTE